MTSTSHPAVDLAAPCQAAAGPRARPRAHLRPRRHHRLGHPRRVGFLGTAVGIAAIVLGLRARSAGVGTRMATAAVVIAGLAVLSVVFFLIVGPPD